MAASIAGALDRTTSAEWRLTVTRPGEPADSGAGLADATDAELVAACLSGQTAAFDVIVERHRRNVYHVCYRFVGNHEDASDLSQDVFLRAFRALHNFKGQSSVGTWLYRIAVNVCLNRVSVKVLATEPIDVRQHVDTRSETATDRLLREERAARVRAAIAKLPDKQRTSLILRMYHEMSHQEIAETLGSTVGAVKANVFHGLQNLKKLLAGDRQ
jgi:RNA polymerase sigma-70 factor (ECF subfamily)